MYPKGPVFWPLRKPIVFLILIITTNKQHAYGIIILMIK